MERYQKSQNEPRLITNAFSTPRSGRCFQCRQRKKKCDELLPACSRCLHAGTKCEYPDFTAFINHYASVGRDVSPAQSHGRDCSTASSNRKDSFHLRKAQDAPSGSGKFRTFTLRQSRPTAPTEGRDVKTEVLPLLRVSQSFTERISANLVSILEATSTSSYGYSLSYNYPWMSYLPKRLEHSQLLQAAVECVLSAYRLRAENNQQSRTYALESYGGAIDSLRRVVLAGEDIRGETIAAVKLLEIFEWNLCRGNTLGWRSHTYGSLDFFLAAGPSFCSGSFERSLLHSSFGAAFFKGLVSGEPSIFDNADWIILEPAPPIGLTTCAGIVSKKESIEMVRLFTMMPRLLKNVRTCRQNPTDSASISAAFEATDNALAFIDQDRWSSTSPPPTATLELCSLGQDAHPFPYKLRFPRPLAFHRAYAHCSSWSAQILIAYICSALIDLEPCCIPQNWPSLSMFADSETRCAIWICASIPDDIELPPHAVPTILSPLQIAWGALWRQYCRNGRSSQTKDLLEWLEARISKFAALVGVTTERHELIALTQIFEGKSTWQFDD